jgi:SOS-response transcriptional repressor LexA
MSNNKLTQRQNEILNFIMKTSQENGFQPSYREIGEAVGLKSVSSVNYQLSQIEAKGYLRRETGNQRAVRLKTLPGAKASFSSIAFETGRILGRQEVARYLETLAANWTKQTSFHYPSELRRLAAEIREEKMNPQTYKEAPDDFIVEAPKESSTDKRAS